MVSADAFHWIDPELRFSKSARLLSPRGWLAVLALQHVYDEPLKTALQEMWVARSDDGGTWLTRPGPTIAEIIGESGYFGTPVEASYSTGSACPHHPSLIWRTLVPPHSAGRMMSAARSPTSLVVASPPSPSV
jgi:hypothetical protein